MRRTLISVFIVAVIIIVIFLVFGKMEEQSEAFLRKLGENKGAYSLYSFLFLTSDVVLPIPSSVIMYINGFILGAVYGTLLSLVSLMISAVIGYLLGRIPGFVKKNSSAFTNKFLAKYGYAAIILTRGVPILSESITIVCGYDRMPWKKFLLYNFIGFVPICILYAYMGEIASEENAFLFALGLSILITIGFWLAGYLFNRKPAK